MLQILQEQTYTGHQHQARKKIVSTHYQTVTESIKPK